MKIKLKAWVEAMRLRTLPVSVAGVLTAVGFNISDGTFKFLPAALCLLFALLCQIASNFANEYFDYKSGRDRSGREGPRRGVTEGDLSPQSMLVAVALTMLLAAATGLSLVAWGGVWLIAVGLIIGLFALAYSAGPYPLSTHCMGEVAVIIFFGIVPVNFTYYVQSLSWSTEVLIASVGVGLMGANVLVVNNWRDRFDDAIVGKHTLANALPRRVALAIYPVNAVVGAMLTLPLWYGMSVAWLLVPIAYIAASMLIFSRLCRYEGHALNPLLGLTAISMLAYISVFIIAALCV